jgi:hypothetical protein
MATNNGADRPARSSHLFMVRMWPEDVGGGRTDWRGKVQHVNSGEARYFRDWPTLEAFVEGLIHGTDETGPRACDGGETGIV